MFKSKQVNLKVIKTFTEESEILPKIIKQMFILSMI